MKVVPHPQWKDTGASKETIDGEPALVTKLEVGNTSTHIVKDGSNNMALTDAVTGTKTLAELASGGGGDVSGPSSSTDKAIVRFDGTTGKIIQDYTGNAPTISDTGDVTIDGDLSADNIINSASVNNITIDTTAPTSPTTKDIWIDIN